MKIFNLLSRFYRTSAKAGMKVSQFLHEVIIVKMLGDVHAERPSAKHNTRLFNLWLKKPYITHLFELFSPYCTSLPIVRSYPEFRPGKEPFINVSHFNTCSLACFNIYRELFYRNGVKIIPINLVDHFTAVSLAYFYMDDGYKTASGFFFCTECFSIQELDIFLIILRDKFGLKANLHSNGRVYIMSSSSNFFLFLALITLVMSILQY